MSEPTVPTVADRTRCDADTAPVSPVCILVVCTANICRSPVVEAILRQRLAARGYSWQVTSAGTLAARGYPASQHSIDVLGARGIDIAGHRSHEVRTQDVEAADLVLCMERSHAEALRVENPAHRHRIHLLTAMVQRNEDVADPYGGPRPWYEMMVEQVAGLLEQGLTRIIELGLENHAARQRQVSR